MSMITFVLSEKSFITLHFISLNSCFVSIRVVERLCTIVEISSRITIRQFLFKSQVCLKTCSLRCMCSGTGGQLTALKPTRKHFQLSTDNKTFFFCFFLFFCYKTLAFSDARHSKDPRNQVIGVLKAGSTVNDIAHHLGCSRQAIHDLINRHTSNKNKQSNQLSLPNQDDCKL